MLHTEIDALLVADSEVLRPPWLATLAEAQGYRLADAILRAAIAADHRPWGMGDHDAPPAIIGCFPADLEIFAEPRPARPHPARRTYPVPTGSLVPDHLVEWRVRAWAKAGVYPGVSIVGDVPLAMPLHDALVKREMNASSFSLAGIRVEAPPRHWVSSHPISVLRAAAEVVRAQGLPFADARRLITEAGYVLPEQLGVPENAVLGDDLPLLRTEDQLVEKHPVTLRPAVVMQLASEAGLPLPEIVARLGSYGFTLPDWFVPGASLPDDGVLGVLAQWGWEGLTPVPPLVVHARATGEDVTHMVAKLEEFGYRRLSAVPPADLSDTDLKLMSRDLDGTNPWLNPVQPIPRAHILRAAHDFGASPQALVERLAQLGYKVPEPSSLPTEPIPVDDFAVLSQDDDGKAPWLEADGDLNATTAITTALHTFRPVGEVMRVWETAGVVEAGSMRIPDDEDFDNLRLISQDLDRKDPWLAHGKPLPLGHVLAAAEAVGREPAAVLARLESLGYHLPEATPLTDDVRPDDVDILRTNGARWLRGERPVPLAHVIRAAAASGRTPVSVARRLSDLGYTLPDGVVFTDAPTV
ncbi:hypothetical protein [Streptomyces sp. t39]|uniref:wHTH domain-containing protein n=1 Tax=Streptomyces sp. t39 TaxID=1828156 RepID=UPI0011CD773F|nr:hypothetical protein [Streptomyces sp. t39]